MRSTPVAWTLHGPRHRYWIYPRHHSARIRIRCMERRAHHLTGLVKSRMPPWLCSTLLVPAPHRAPTHFWKIGRSRLIGCRNPTNWTRCRLSSTASSSNGLVHGQETRLPARRTLGVRCIWSTTSSKRVPFDSHAAIIAGISCGDRHSFAVQVRFGTLAGVQIYLPFSLSPDCHINVHSRCINQVQLICAQQPRHRDDTNGHVVPRM